jgi:hypothetical protein
MGFKIIEITLGSAIADDGTLTGIAYPSGTNQAYFTGGALSNTGKAIINYNDVYNQADPGIGITYGASTITLTNLSGVTWPATSHVTLQLGYAAGLTVSDLSGLTATVAEMNRVADVSTRVVSITATGSITEAANEGKRNLLNASALVTLTMPASTGSGARYRFIVGTVNTSNYVIQKAGSDVFSGQVQIWDRDAATSVSFFDAAGSSSSDVFTLNGTTTGGSRVGDWVEFADDAAGIWTVTGVLSCPTSSNPATPFA